MLVQAIFLLKFSFPICWVGALGYVISASKTADISEADRYADNPPAKENDDVKCCLEARTPVAYTLVAESVA